MIILLIISGVMLPFYNRILTMIRVHLSRLMGERKKRIADIQRETRLARNTLSGLYFETSSRIDFDTIDALCRYFDCQVADLLEFVPADAGEAR